MGSGVSTLTTDELEAQLDEEERKNLLFIRQVWEGESWLRPYTRARILSLLQQEIQQALNWVCFSNISISVLHGFGLKSADILTSSDPYVVVKLNDEVSQTRVIANNNTPVWNETLFFSSPGGRDGDTIYFEVLDKDFLGRDDNIGHASYRVQKSSLTMDEPVQMMLSGGQGSLVVKMKCENAQNIIFEEIDGSFDNVLQACDAALDEIARANREEARNVLNRICDQVSKLATEIMERKTFLRKEIRTLDADESRRYIEAVKLLMKPDSQRKRGTISFHEELDDRKLNEVDELAETSEYFQLASIHGWPKAFCTHREENFPVWHRLYLMEFEAALSAADKELGNDGCLALPYWDFTVYKLNDQVLPKVYEDIPNLPENFFKAGRKGIQINDIGYKLNSDAKVFALLEKNQTKERMYSSLDEASHWQHASSENTSGRPIEDPHNTAHMVAGFPLNNLGIASFHPLFFNIHCNIDRFYESFLNDQPTALEEFKARQEMREREGKVNKFTEPLKPFRKLGNHNEDQGEYFSVETVLTTSIKDFGYIYDSIPMRQPPQMRELPTMVLFQGVDVVRGLVGPGGIMKSFQLHIFILPKSAETYWDGKVVWDENCTPVHTQVLSKSGALLWKYAGWVTALGAKGKTCRNCTTTKPVTLSLDVTNVFREIGESDTSDFAVKVIAVDELGVICPFELLQEMYGVGVDLPSPTLVGPRLLSLVQEKILRPGDSGPQVAVVQEFLSRRGFLKGSTSNIFNEDCACAVKAYQRFHGLEETGTVDDKTWNLLSLKRNDHQPDTEVSLLDTFCLKDMSAFKRDEKIPYCVGPAPGYLSRPVVLETVEQALKQWEQVAPISFEYQTNSDDCRLYIYWTDRSESNESRFDGPGGTIAHTTTSAIEFDINENWITESLEKESNLRSGFKILPVLLHEIGHFLGMRYHSPNIQDVMSPYYVGNRTKLSDFDLARCRSMFSDSEEG